MLTSSEGTRKTRFLIVIYADGSVMLRGSSALVSSASVTTARVIGSRHHWTAFECQFSFRRNPFGSQWHSSPTGPDMSPNNSIHFALNVLSHKSLKRKRRALAHPSLALALQAGIWLSISRAVRTRNLLTSLFGLVGTAFFR